MEKYKYKRLKGNNSPRDNSFNLSWVARQFKGIREAVAGVDLETRRKEAVTNGFYTITAHGFLFHTAALMDLSYLGLSRDVLFKPGSGLINTEGKLNRKKQI